MSNILPAWMRGVELVHVPTVAELAREGHAKIAPGGKGGVYTLTDEGQQRIYAAMRENATRVRAAMPERVYESTMSTEDTLAAMKRSELGHKRARQIIE